VKQVETPLKGNGITLHMGERYYRANAGKGERESFLKLNSPSFGYRSGEDGRGFCGSRPSLFACLLTVGTHRLLQIIVLNIFAVFSFSGRGQAVGLDLLDRSLI
jgi:hypothetical protein